MKPSTLLPLIVLPCLAYAQSSGSTTTSSAQSSSLTSSISLSAGGSPSGSGSLSVPSGNATSSRVSSSKIPLSTAPTNVDGGGQNGATGGAPLPGQSAPGGVYGPPDGYIAAGVGLDANLLGSLGGAVALGLLILV